MDAIIEIKQKIEALESGIIHEDARSLEALLSEFGSDPASSTSETQTLVKMMTSITKYLAEKKQNSHGDALPLLGRLCTDLEVLVRTPAVSPHEARQIVAQELASFRTLKTAILSTPLISKSDFEALQAVILSVDWEISDDTLDSFDKVISSLKEKLQSDKVQFTFLRIMNSLGGYIARNGSDADNDAITLLQSVFQDFEKLVKTPDMSMLQKKTLVDDNIFQYNEFKHRIVSQSAAADPGASQSDDELPPALSHVGGATVPVGEATLSVLSETDNVGDPIVPALSGMNKAPEPKRDVMDDLFSPKASPADELLDAIHMSELHGSAPQPPQDLMGASPDEVRGDGIKNYTPERVEQDPIPEIGSRLDEFFNLDVSEDSMLEVSTEKESLTEASTYESFDAPGFDDDSEEDDDDEFIQPGLSEFVSPDAAPLGEFGTDDGIETLDNEELDDDIGDVDDVDDFIPALDFAPTSQEDEKGEGVPLEVLSNDADEIISSDHGAFDSQIPELDVASMMGDLDETDSCDAIMTRLKKVLNGPEGLTDDATYIQTLTDISALDQLWMEDGQTKVQLLDILRGLIQYIHATVNVSEISDAKTDLEGSLNSLMDNVPEQSGDSDEDVQPIGSEDDQKIVSDEAQFDDGCEAEEEIEKNQPENKGGFWAKLQGIFRK